MVLNRIKCNQRYHIWQKTPTGYSRLFYESFPSEPTFNIMEGLSTFTEQKWVHYNTSEETTKMKSKKKLAVANSDHYFWLQTGKGWMLTSVWNSTVINARFRVSAGLCMRYLSFVIWCCITAYLVTDILTPLQSLKTSGTKHQVIQHHIYKQQNI
jgi:hypothetical protein